MMVKNIVAGLVVVVLIVMVVLAYAQQHHECWHGHLLKRWHGHLLNLGPCGSVDPSE
jgi:hypothetical protein